MNRCPHCKIKIDDNPDLYMGCGEGKTKHQIKAYKKQFKILKKMQAKGFNVVTCGDCGDVILEECRT